MKYSALVLLALLLAVGGCGEKGPVDRIVDTWHTTKDFIDPAPTISTDRYQLENPNQVELAKLFAPVDGPLTSLSRFLENTDTLPGIDWMELLHARFPWVNTVLVTDEQGNIICRQPETPLKRLVKPLLVEGDGQNRDLITRVDYTDLGPELYISRPYFKDVSFRGVFGVGFDPRMLLMFSPDPQKLVIVQPGKGVFARGAVDSEALLAVNWDELLADEVTGEVKAGEKYYTWIARYIGSDPFVYAIESVEPNADEGWF